MSDNKMAAPEASVCQVRSRLCYHYFLYQRKKVDPKVFQEGVCCLDGLILLAGYSYVQMVPRLNVSMVKVCS